MNERLEALDGVRGVAALVVVVFHFFAAFSPSLIPDFSLGSFEWFDTPLALLLNGGFAVSLFFVLSGFVLARGAVANRGAAFGWISGRFLRLILPSWVSVMFAWLLLSCFPNEVAQFASATPGPWLKWTYQEPIPSAGEAVLKGVTFVFSGESQFNNVLWTMRAEFLGSALVYILAANFQRYALPIWFFILACFLLGRSSYCLAFLLGYFLFLMRSRHAVGVRAASVLIVLGLFLASPSHGFLSRLGVDWGVSNFWLLGEKNGFWHPVAAACLVAGVLDQPNVSRFLSGRFFRFLGRVSFSVYLLHVPLIYTICFYLANRFEWRSMEAIVLLLAGFLLVLFGMAMLFERWVDRPVVALTRRWRSLFA